MISPPWHCTNADCLETQPHRLGDSICRSWVGRVDLREEIAAMIDNELHGYGSLGIARNLADRILAQVDGRRMAETTQIGSVRSTTSAVAKPCAQKP